MGYYPQESLYKPYKYHGYTVRGTHNCPLIKAAVTLSLVFFVGRTPPKMVSKNSGFEDHLREYRAGPSFPLLAGCVFFKYRPSTMCPVSVLYPWFKQIQRITLAV